MSAETVNEADKYEAKLDEYEKQQETAKAAHAKRFDPKALSAKTTKIYSVTDPDLGEIRYSYLNTSEFAEAIKDCKSEAEIVDNVILKMLQKADKTLTAETYKALPFDVKASLNIIMGKLFTRFLRFTQQKP